MKRTNVGIMFSVLILVCIVGFFFVLSKLQIIQDEVRNVALNLDIFSSGITSIPETVTPASDEATTTLAEPRRTYEGSVVIPTAILFQIESSPLLSPTTQLTVSVEKVSKAKDGFLTLHIKTFTNRATSYSAFDPGNFFELVEPSRSNQKPVRVRGAFDSMPPQSAVEGEVVFKIDSGQTEAVLKVDSGNGGTYYEFDFTNGTYKEAILG